MTNSDTRAAKNFKKAVTAAKNRKDMFWRSQAPELAFMITDALEQFTEEVKDPHLGVKTLLDFYKRDTEIFERCDDSFGNVGDVFRITAAKMFAGYASRCPDKDRIIAEILELQGDDGYGIRDVLIDKASVFLNKSDLRKLIDKIEQSIPAHEDITRQRKWLYMIESLARQIKDGALFERTRQRNWQGLNSRAYIDIAKVYFSSGDALAAYDRLQKAAECGSKDEYEYAELFRDVCRSLGRKEEVRKILRDIFRGSRCTETLNDLLSEIGEGKRAETVYQEADLIMAAKEFSVTDAQFLFDAGEVNCAQDYIIKRHDQINGEQYYILPPLAERFEAKGLYLTAVVIYRALLDANLAGAVSKYYSHGVRYLRKLDALADQVSDWRGIETHADYAQRIKQAHGRKPAFWAKYERRERHLVQN